jgi:cytidine deaminase
VSDLFKDLVDAACAARNNSHSPYSHFRVGAALLAASGKVYPGTNVENASIGLSICAERAAVCGAIARGEKAFTAIAVCADGAEPTPPCGACRQFLLEFGRDLRILVAGENGSAGEVREYVITDLIPHAFETYLEPETPAAGGEEGTP